LMPPIRTNCASAVELPLRFEVGDLAGVGLTVSDWPAKVGDVLADAHRVVCKLHLREDQELGRQPDGDVERFVHGTLGKLNPPSGRCVPDGRRGILYL